ncbi:MAG TPA: hypothetical protein VG733_19530 [Chthoniobacteraceae bacterium]|nr:hypothetical protein [Chthoniobacteraceae bacterium]
MSVKASASNLEQAVKELMFEWDQVKAFWNDVKSREFAHKFLEDLPANAARTAGVMQDLDGLLKKVRSDCE